MNYKITFPENYVKPKLPFRDKWCAALRSGEFKQGRGFLKREKESNCSYCCLGVLCEIENVKFPDLEVTIPDESHLYNFIGATGQFPEGVKIENEKLSNGFTLYLTTTNDYSGLSFLEIADVIEQIWEQE